MNKHSENGPSEARFLVLILFVSIILHLICKRPVKNLTIGKFQIGIATILKYYGKNIDEHTRRIEQITVQDILCIYKSIGFNNQLSIVSKMILRMYILTLQKEIPEQDRTIHIGELYNGTYGYGLMLNEICCELN